MRAYILIETRVSSAASLVAGVRGLDFPPATTLISAEVVTGPFDVIVVVDTPELNALVRYVTDRIQLIDGVERTITCVSLESSD